MPNINWNANDYKNGFSFVPEYGELQKKAMM